MKASKSLNWAEASIVLHTLLRGRVFSCLTFFFILKVSKKFHEFSTPKRARSQSPTKPKPKSDESEKKVSLSTMSPSYKAHCICSRTVQQIRSVHVDLSLHLWFSLELVIFYYLPSVVETAVSCIASSWLVHLTLSRMMNSKSRRASAPSSVAFPV